MSRPFLPAAPTWSLRSLRQLLPQQPTTTSPTNTSNSLSIPLLSTPGVLRECRTRRNSGVEEVVFLRKFVNGSDSNSNSSFSPTTEHSTKTNTNMDGNQSHSMPSTLQHLDAMVRMVGVVQKVQTEAKPLRSVAFVWLNLEQQYYQQKQNQLQGLEHTDTAATGAIQKDANLKNHELAQEANGAKSPKKTNTTSLVDLASHSMRNFYVAER